MTNRSDAAQVAADTIFHGKDAGEVREYLEHRLATGTVPYAIWRTGVQRMAQLTGMTRSEVEWNLRTSYPAVTCEDD